MSDLVVRSAARDALTSVVRDAPATPTSLTDDHRRALAARFRAVPDPDHRRLDAWTVERAGLAGAPFTWTPAAARRSVATAALRRAGADGDRTLAAAVRATIEDEVARARTGQTRPGSLGRWLDEATPGARGLVVAEALSWARGVLEMAHRVEGPWWVPAADAYYDVAGARVTLRGRRDLEVAHGEGRVVVRLRAGSPGPSAGAGLRADLVTCALADPAGVAPTRVVGVWPEAGVVLGVDGTIEDLRAGARDLVRAALATRRARLVLAA